VGKLNRAFFNIPNLFFYTLSSTNDAVSFFTTQKKIKSVCLNAAVIEEVQKTNQEIVIAFDSQSYYWTDVTDGKESIVKTTPGSKKEILVKAGSESPEDFGSPAIFTLPMQTFPALLFDPQLDIIALN
jgi:hypothetical protein